jgi:4-alpha-glucanotransferase
MRKRASGILLHISSLPGPYGIGDLGPQAFAFADALEGAGQCLWQVLPLGPTGYGDSPYQSFSTFAGNELLISPDILLSQGWLRKDDLSELPAFPSGRVDFGWVIHWKKPLLFKAARRFSMGAAGAERAAYEAFREKNAAWLDDYALFMSIKEHYTALAIKADVFGAMWANYWPKELARGEAAALAAWRREKADDIEDRAVLQYFFFSQLEAMKSYANGKGIGIIGDIPIFVAYDSVDVWAGRGLFRLEPDGTPMEVAGVPPDYFSADGQLWGNPLYDWEVHARDGFAWWIRRVKAALSMYDIVRIDHFRGFEANWAVPQGQANARTGTWRKGPGRELFRALQGELGQDLPVIAEDLGLITPEVHALRDEFGLPGMRVLQFAFNPDESGAALSPENGFLPHNYEPNAFVYTGTHDNDTLRGWLEEKASPLLLKLIDEYLERPADRVRAMIREALKSVAAWAVIPLQDILGLDNSARMNTPSTLGAHNWSWRMEEPGLPAEASFWLKRTSALFNRNARRPEP